MNTKSQMSNTGFMPREVAVIFLTSKHSKTAGFRKRCFRAMERVCEPKSRSTTLSVSAPKTGAQRLQARLVKATAEQLHRWAKRTLTRGNRYEDLRFETQRDLETAPAEEMETLWAAEKTLTQQIVAHNGLIDAINAELTARSTRGVGYRQPVRFRL